MNRQQRRSAARQALSQGVRALAEEAQGVIQITTVQPEDFVLMLADLMAGHSDHLNLLRTVSDLVDRVTKARNTATPLLCAACPAELTDGYAVVVATGAARLPKHGLGMGVCTACGTDLDSIEAAALKGLHGIWPDLRRINIHHEAGRA